VFTVYSYAAYLVISIVLTVWVGRTLYSRGRIFVLDAFRGNEALADSVNHLLIVGFYLVNIGLVTLAMKYGDKPTDAQEALEWLSTKVGLVLVVLGGMHFFNVFNFAKMRRKGLRPAAHCLDDGNQSVEALDRVKNRGNGGHPAVCP
jgi:hypothetical protein